MYKFVIVVLLVNLYARCIKVRIKLFFLRQLEFTSLYEASNERA